jgi:hypothetical protein
MHNDAPTWRQLKSGQSASNSLGGDRGSRRGRVHRTIDAERYANKSEAEWEGDMGRGPWNRRLSLICGFKLWQIPISVVLCSQNIRYLRPRG